MPEGNGNHSGDRHLDDIFYKVWGEAPSDEERQVLLRLRDVFGIGNNDALWIIVVALRYHLKLYEGIPGKIVAAVKEILGLAQDSAAASVKASAAAVERQLVDKVSKTVDVVSRRRSLKELVLWVSVSVAAVVVVVGVGVWMAYDHGKTLGQEQGWHEGYREALDEKAAASWANTPEGRRAYRLSQLSSMARLIECRSPGWRIKDGVCFPYPEGETTYGWRIQAAASED